MGLELLRSGQWVARIQWALHLWLFQGRNSLGREGGGWGCPSFQTDHASPLRSVCFTFLFYFLFLPDAWDLTLLLIIFSERSRKFLKDRKKKKEKKKEMASRTLYKCEHVCRGADPSWKMTLWKRPSVPNSWAAASLLWLLLYHFPSDEADQDKSAFLSLCLGPAPSLCQLLLCWGSWVWEILPGSFESICSSTRRDGVSSGSHGSRDTTNKTVPGFRGWRVKASLAPQHCLRSSWAAIYPWSPKAR